MTSFHAYHLKNISTPSVFTALQPHLHIHIPIVLLHAEKSHTQSFKSHLSTLKSYADCLMTSGAIQKGVPTNVFLLIWVSVSCPATPKSASFTSPCSDSSTLAAATRYKHESLARNSDFTESRRINYEAFPSRPSCVGRRVGYHTFDITVNLPLRMQVFQSLQNLPQYSGNVRLL